MGNLRAACSVLVLGAVLGCDNDYPLPPTPCDDYCLATQRAGCEEDWPSECVRQCEFSRSPTLFPNCAAEFDASVACYGALDDDDFQCVADVSEPRPGACQDESRSLDFCIEPAYYRCLAICEDRNERCAESRYECLSGCQSVPDECEDAAVPFFDCVLGETSTCDLQNCTASAGDLYDCVASVRDGT